MAKPPSKKPAPAKKAPPKKTGPKGPTKDVLDEKTFKHLIEMIKIQCTRDEICNILGMSDTTLNRRLKARGEQNFEALYEKHSSEGKMSLRRLQLKQAKTSVAMSMHLGKHQLGQTEKQVPQQTTIILNGSADDL